MKSLEAWFTFQIKYVLLWLRKGKSSNNGDLTKPERLFQIYLPFFIQDGWRERQQEQTVQQPIHFSATFLHRHDSLEQWTKLLRAVQEFQQQLIHENPKLFGGLLNGSAMKSQGHKL